MDGDSRGKDFFVPHTKMALDGFKRKLCTSPMGPLLWNV